MYCTCLVCTSSFIGRSSSSCAHFFEAHFEQVISAMDWGLALAEAPIPRRRV